MKKRQRTQYTIRQVPDRVNRTIREKATKEHKSLNEAALDALSRGLGLTDEAIRYHDMDDLAGTWQKDPSFDKALRDMDRVDRDLWK